jgi:hypothetical protein
MKRLPLLFMLALVCALNQVGAAGADQKPLNCVIGPLKRTYGNTPWLVYSCDDNKTVVIVTDTGSPAMPFYFTFYMKDGRYHLGGEGTGNKALTDTAFSELSRFTNADIEKLIRETKAVKSH